MPTTDISATIKNGEHKGKAVAIKYDPGETLEALTKKYGAEAVASAARAHLVIQVQNIMRNALSAGKSQKDIQTLVDAYKPGSRPKGKTKAEKVAEMLKDMDPAAKAKLLSDLSGSSRASASRA